MGVYITYGKIMRALAREPSPSSHIVHYIQASAPNGFKGVLGELKNGTFYGVEIIDTIRFGRDSSLERFCDVISGAIGIELSPIINNVNTNSFETIAFFELFVSSIRNVTIGPSAILELYDDFTVFQKDFVNFVKNDHNINNNDKEMFIVQYNELFNILEEAKNTGFGFIHIE